MAEKKDASAAAAEEGKKPGAEQDKKKPDAAADEDQKKSKAGDDDPGAGEGDGAQGDGDGGDGAGKDGEGDAEDWRVRLAGGNEKRLAFYKRFTDEAAFDRHVEMLEKKVREKGWITPPKADAPVEEKAKFYTEHFGRPEKVEDVKISISLPDGVEALPGEVMETVKSVTGELHKAGVFGEEHLAIAQQLIADQYLGAAKELESAADTFRAKSEETLKKVWKRDFDANVNLAASYCAMRCEEVGVDRHALANIRLQNGALLGDDPLFLQVMAKGGRDYNEDPRMNREEIGGQRATDLKDALDKELAKRNGTAAEKKYYESAEGQARRAKLRKDLKLMGGAGAKR
jgi:hypothetical protein